MEATLEATTRDTFGKNEARRTRREGRVPAVLYGGDGKEATPIAVPPKALLKILHSESGQNTLISLKLAGASDTRVLVKDFQIDPVTHEVLHADFYRIAMDRVLQVTIPVTVHGEPKGVKQQGGVLDIVHRQVEIESIINHQHGGGLTDDREPAQPHQRVEAHIAARVVRAEAKYRHSAV